MDNPIRILHVVGGMGPGGLETMIMNWYRKIDKSKIQFDFLVHHKERCFYDDEIEALGGKIYHLSLANDYNFIKYWFDLKRFFKDNTQYKIVHGHHSTFGFFYLTAAKNNGIKWRISHSHIASYSKTIRGIIFYLMSRLFKKSANVHYACSKLAGDYMYGNSKYVVINNGIDTNRFRFEDFDRERIRNQFGLKDSFVVCHVGRFFDQKNHDFLVDVFHEFQKKSNSHLLLIGVGPLQDTIRRKVHRLGLDNRVIFLNEQRNVPSFLSASDMFLFPSLYEGLPLTLVEAQTSGLPILCSDTISTEAKINDNYFILSLSDSAEVWAEKMYQIKYLSTERTEAFARIKNHGYDSEDVVNFMQYEYISMSKY